MTTLCVLIYSCWKVIIKLGIKWGYFIIGCESYLHIFKEIKMMVILIYSDLNWTKMNLLTHMLQKEVLKHTVS